MELPNTRYALLVLLLSILLPAPAIATCTISSAADIAACNIALAERETDINVLGAFACKPGTACTIRIRKRTPDTGWITVRGNGHLASHLTNPSVLCRLPVIWMENSDFVLIRDIGKSETYACGSGPSTESPHDGMGVGIGPYSSHLLVTGMRIEAAATHALPIGHSDLIAVMSG
jgi:hypothetical protein